MDALSEVLKTIRLTGAAFFASELRAPWSIVAPSSRAIADALLPDADHVVPYHLVTAGRCVVKLLDGTAVDLAAGDVVVLPKGDHHMLGGTPQFGPLSMPAEDLTKLLKRGTITPIRGGGDGAVTGMVCGFFACDARLSAPIIDGLPRVLRVSLSDDPGAHWLRSSVDLSVLETAQPRAGAETMLAKLSELLFVETIHRYIKDLPDHERGWLPGLRNPHIAKALAFLHGRPEYPWTVEEVARKVGLSRTVLAERFMHYLGQPPMQYLTSWRLALAADRLRDGRTSIGRVAEQVGYDSETSFTRAFKRAFGLPPATWRRKKAQAPAAAAPRWGVAHRETVAA
jgi:AraC family transcriptional regulator, alkane utilization regulator